MAMQNEIVAELKRALREGGHTYAAVARQLHLSVATVKRLFSQRDFTLQRMDQICELLGVELSVIIERAQDHGAPGKQLTLDQEREIISDPGLFLIAWLALGRTSFEEMVRNYRFAAAEVQRFLIKLDRLRVIELQPGNRVRLLVSRRFPWRRGGPVQRYIHQKLLKEFLADDFAQDAAEFFFHGDAVTARGLSQMKRVLQHAARDCMEIMERDRSVPERGGAAVVLALRPWEYSGFVQLRRRK